MSAEPVLMYHSVAPYDRDPFRVTVRPDRFAAQMRWLRRTGRRGVSMAELLDARAVGTADRLVGLTFDDGYADFCTYALPVLLRHRFTATVFVLAGRFGGVNDWDRPGPSKPLMTADDVRRVAHAGMEIGSHGLLHLPLTDVDASTLDDEVCGSRSILGTAVAGFCYPYGLAGAREVAAVRAAGYTYACAVRPSVADDRFLLPRTFVGDRDGATRLAAKWVRHRVAGVRERA